MIKNPLSHPSVKFFLLLLLLFITFQLGRLLQIDIDIYQSLLQSYPKSLTGFVFILLYVVVTFFLFFSNDVLRLLAAILFGAYWSTFFVTVAELINAAILFHLARRLGKEFVEKRFKMKFKAPEQNGTDYLWRIFLLRIVPLVPFRFLDLGFGLSSVSFHKYFLVCLFASPLRIFWIQFILAGVGVAVLKDPTVLLQYLQKNQSAFLWSLGYLVFSIVALIILGSRKRRSA